ncbi:MAG TPA: class I lanthipeptide, partial [Ferruginibacter sp.]|nr:class I lanthipeptide [Ferruginibacter sp.]
YVCIVIIQLSIKHINSKQKIMKQSINNNQKLNLQKKTIKRLSTANMSQILGGVKKTNDSTNPVTVPPNGTH